MRFTHKQRVIKHLLELKKLLIGLFALSVNVLPAMAAGPSVPLLRHTFSHFHLDIQPVLVRVSEFSDNQIMEQAATVWYNLPHPPKVGLAAATERVLADLGSVLNKE